MKDNTKWLTDLLVNLYEAGYNAGDFSNKFTPAINEVVSNYEHQILKAIEDRLPSKLKYDVAVALRDGTYQRGQDFKVEGYNQAIKEIRASFGLEGE